MADLKTKYLGIELKNPIIVGACNLVTDTKNLKKMEEAGASAIVYKSLFEEQIQLENFEQDETMEGYNDRHAEMTQLFPDLEHAGPKEHLLDLKEAKEAVNIPVFASLNAVYDDTWLDYAKQIEETGVDGLELNFYSVPKSYNQVGREIIHNQIEIMEEVKSNLKIPVAVKLSPYYTNPLYVISQMDSARVNGFILFNRLFQPDIDIEKEEHFFPYNISNVEDNRLALRYAGMLHGNIDGSICANSGIYSGKDIVKMLLAGADAVQVVSSLYKNGIGHISDMLKEVEEWMDHKGYKSLNDFRGKLSQKEMKDPFAYTRAQYVDILLKSEKIFEKYPLI